ncbi:hypothetical protein THAOC_16982 [Thalassiosira oceanica]|uniref:Uncharacterized protein n=1 Tax=Thalassiosira oceanica TaxID=159749 RepID=K0SVX2_THAOC|nr:hypothetical protein THAOC_16982 [Thalassiosira oceanica]|eukprot:EJK62407.1 hypothetical protein THAOC_16982 [Thalassiosira oceanica]
MRAFHRLPPTRRASDARTARAARMERSGGRSQRVVFFRKACSRDTITAYFPSRWGSYLYYVVPGRGCDENRAPPRRHAAGLGHACPHKASGDDGAPLVAGGKGRNSLEGLYFGKNGDRVDAFGSNLCCASLPGGGFRVLHDQVKTLIITFFRLSGVTANDEDTLWMLGRVPDPYMRRYTDWILRAEDRKYPDGTIVADFVARDCPTPTQASNDSGLGGRSDILGEVKTIQPGKSSYQKGNCQANPPTNQRASNVRLNYRKRTLDLDRAHAPEVVGDGTNGQVGPFEEALGRFHIGIVFPIVAGAFGKVNEDASS